MTCTACRSLLAEATAMEAASLADQDVRAALALDGDELNDLIAGAER